ncbi:MAG: GxxExxY protein [Planctomycetota bacterium]
MEEPNVYLHKELTENVIAAAIEVHKILGRGYVEKIYEQALAIELEGRVIPCERQVSVHVEYKGKTAGTHRIDIVVDNLVVVEVKAVTQLVEIHEAQILSSMKAGNFKVGLLMNFHAPTLVQGLKRFVL